MNSNVYDFALITGGRGMLASALVRALELRGVRFVALARADLDISNPTAVAEAFVRYKPTLVLNCAAHTKVDLCEQQQELADAINGMGVGHLAAECKRTGAKLVHYSTDFVFDGSKRQPYVTTDAVHPLSAYGRSKLLGEQQLQEVNPPGWLLIRTAWVYGPNGPCFPQTMVNAAKAAKPLRVVCDQIGTPTYTRDLADATLALLDLNASDLFHFTNAGETNWFHFTQAILEEFGLAPDLQSITSDEWQKLRPQSAIRPAYSVLDTSDFTRITGTVPRPWRAALRDYRAAIS